MINFVMSVHFSMESNWKSKFTGLKDHHDKDKLYHFIWMQELMTEIKIRDLAEFRQVSLWKNCLKKVFIEFLAEQLLQILFQFYLYSSCSLASSPSSGSLDLQNYVTFYKKFKEILGNHPGKSFHRFGNCFPSRLHNTNCIFFR